MKNELSEVKNINNIYENIKTLINNSKENIYRVVNTEILNLYWNIGKIIVDIQDGKNRAKYGDKILENLSLKLTNEFGNGFSKRNLERMRKFYIFFPNTTTMSSQLTWSHYTEIIKIKDKKQREFYMKECIEARWSVRELQRQIHSLLYERLALSKNKVELLEMANKGAVIKNGKDLVKDPFVLEFLDIKENMSYLESDLEANILKHIREFLLELGKGFMFVGSKVRITLETDHFYPDLIFYNRLLKCFVIIDLKIHKLTHQDIGQMQMYVNYYDRVIKKEDENATIGILLGTSKNETVVEYTLPENNKSVYASIYKLGFPSKEELISVIEKEKELIELNK